MSDGIPLGQRESQTLEFKGAESLRKPETLGREIVGMLNAIGGRLWIGLAEQDGLAARVEPIANPDRAARTLLDHLIETIAPSLCPEDVKIETRIDSTGAAVLLVMVADRGKNRPPYGYRTRHGWYFGIRVADRLRAMSWQEIFSDSSQALSAAQARWLEATGNVTRQLENALKMPAPRYWLYLKPAADLQLQFRSDVDDLFAHAEKSHNRATGWNFVDRHLRVRPRSNAIEHGDPSTRHTTVWRDGSILFTAPLEFLHWKGEPGLIWPYIFIEFTVSIFRLAAHLYADRRVDDPRIAAQLGLISARGWMLKPGSVRNARWLFEDGAVLQEDDAISALTELRLDRLLEAPDVCAYPLIQDVYAAFGLRADDLPTEFDPESGLAFPP